MLTARFWPSSEARQAGGSVILAHFCVERRQHRHPRTLESEIAGSADPACQSCVGRRNKSTLPSTQDLGRMQADDRWNSASFHRVESRGGVYDHCNSRPILEFLPSIQLKR